MRWLANYFRQVFCAHTFLYTERNYETRGWNDEVVERNLRVSATCSKCGYHRSYNKY